MPKLTIDIEARLAGFQDSLNKIVKSSEDTVSKISKTFSAIRFGVAGAAAVLAGKQIADAFQGAVNQAENFNKLAQRTGIAVESLSAFAVAAQLADVEQADLATGLKKLAVSMNEAASGSKEQVELFKSVGVSFQNANGSLRSTDDVLRDLADRFASFEDGPRKAALAVAFFGKAGDALIPFLNNLRKTEDEAKKLGAVFGTDFAKQAEEFNDNVKRMGIVAQGTGIQIAQFFLPRLNDIATEMVKTAEKSGRVLAILQAIGKASNLAKTDTEKLADEIDRLGKLEAEISRLNQSPYWRHRNPGKLEALIAERNEINKTFAARSRLDRLTADAAEELGGFTAPLPAPKVPEKKDVAAKADPFRAFLKGLELDLAKAGEEGNKFTETFNRLDKEFGKRSEAERATALRLAAEIETRRDIAETQRQTAADRTKEAEDEARRDDERKKRLQSLKDEIEGTVEPTTVLNKKLAEISELVNAGLIDPDIAEAYVGKLNQSFNETNKVFGDVIDSTANVNDAARDLGLTFSSAFEDALVEGKDLSDVLKGIEKDLIRIAARKLVTEPLANVFTGMLASALGGAVAGAGVQLAGGTDYVPQDMPAYLHKGEEVVPAAWTGRNGGGEVSINVNVETSGAQGDPAQSGRIMGAAVADAVRREIMTQQRSGGLLAPA